MRKIDIGDRLTQEDYMTSQILEQDIETIMRLVDMIFLFKEDKDIPS